MLRSIKKTEVCLRLQKSSNVFQLFLNQQLPRALLFVSITQESMACFFSVLISQGDENRVNIR